MKPSVTGQQWLCRWKLLVAAAGTPVLLSWPISQGSSDHHVLLPHINELTRTGRLRGIKEPEGGGEGAGVPGLQGVREPVLSQACQGLPGKG